MHNAIRQSLAFNLKAIVCQKLLPSLRPGVQRVPANEIMTMNPTMRDRETFEAGMNAAETGHLVFGIIHASSAPSTIGRILDLFPADMHSAMRQSLAFNLKAIVCQKLLPSIKPGVQRVPANEIMSMNPTIRDLIIKGEDEKLPDAIRIGLLEGMLDFNESLRQLVARRRRSVRRPAGVPQPRRAQDGFQGHQGGSAGNPVSPAEPVRERGLDL